MAKKFLKKAAVQGIGQTRALLYTAESLPLPLLHNWIVGGERDLPNEEQQKYALKKAQELLQIDAQDFAEHDWPVSLLYPEQPLNHFPRWIQIMGDSTLSFWRRRNKKTQTFSKKVKNLHEFPKYYQRNFHHQTDGYLTEQSARFYEHQVELLFRGLADPMRRRLLKPLVKKLKNKKNPKILEIACGSGTFTRYLRQAIPQARITAIDISPAYINFAKKRFLGDPKIDFAVAQAEDLPFKNESFDAVVSVYLHHELPKKVRELALQESLRVTKEKGFWGMVDSIQLDDDEMFNWAIESFPKTFHEPFFTNYIKNPLLPFLQGQDKNRQFKEKNYLLSKVIYSS